MHHKGQLKRDMFVNNKENVPDAAIVILNLISYKIRALCQTKFDVHFKF